MGLRPVLMTIGWVYHQILFRRQMQPMERNQVPERSGRAHRIEELANLEFQAI